MGGGAPGNFGWSIALDDARLAVSAPGESSVGIVYLFEPDEDGLWQEVGSVAPPEGVEWFGNSVSTDRDRLVVSAYLADYSGTALIYERDSEGIWNQAASFIGENSIPFDGFGESVSVRGDYAGVGSRWSGDGRGEVFIYERDAEGVWGSTETVHASDGVDGDSFGTSVVLSGGLAVTGAQYEDQYGAVYAFPISSMEFEPQGRGVTRSGGLGHVNHPKNPSNSNP